MSEQEHVVSGSDLYLPTISLGRFLRHKLQSHGNKICQGDRLRMSFLSSSKALLRRSSSNDTKAAEFRRRGTSQSCAV
uniref:Uncharacterized protein n=1 Tax=Timema poppense TaxID=170557 RepID=A0A7R9CI55_TIMPO|nr:unnamed protein product [Timema poppensis]